MGFAPYESRSVVAYLEVDLSEFAVQNLSMNKDHEQTMDSVEISGVISPEATASTSLTRAASLSDLLQGTVQQAAGFFVGGDDAVDFADHALELGFAG